MPVTILFSYNAALLYQILAVVLLLIVAFSIVLKKALKERSLRKTAEEKLKDLHYKVQNLEMETIKHKLNPHLFKNVLNSIQSHAYQTYHALDKLAGVLDYILYESDDQLVSINQEVKFAENLIEINRIKLSPLFDLNVKVDMGKYGIVLNEPLVPPLIFATLIENAFKHADIQNEDAFISIRMVFHHGKLVLEVANKISEQPMLRKEHSGFGSGSLQKRLEAVYGPHYKLDKEIKDRIYKVSLKIDVIEYKDKMHTGG